VHSVPSSVCYSASSSPLAECLWACLLRGRGAELSAQPREYGEQDVRQRVDGAELLQAALLKGDNEDEEEEPRGKSQARYLREGHGAGTAPGHYPTYGQVLYSANVLQLHCTSMSRLLEAA
jgi:hypothetical protein